MSAVELHDDVDPIEAELRDRVLIKVSTLERICDIGSTFIYERIADGTFKKRKHGDSTTFIEVWSVRAWIDGMTRVEARERKGLPALTDKQMQFAFRVAEKALKEAETVCASKLLPKDARAWGAMGRLRQAVDDLRSIFGSAPST